MTTVFDQHRDVLINFTTDGPLSDFDFAEWMARLREPAIKYFLSAAVGTVGLSSKQRQTSAELVRQRGIRSAIVTDDRIGRGLITAVSWMGADIRAFSWNELIDAAEFLKVPESEREQVADLVQSLRRTASTSTK